MPYTDKEKQREYRREWSQRTDEKAKKRKYNQRPYVKAMNREYSREYGRQQSSTNKLRQLLSL